MKAILSGKLSAISTIGDVIPMGDLRLMDDGKTVEGDLVPVYLVSNVSRYEFKVPRRLDTDLRFTLPSLDDRGAEFSYDCMVSIHGSVEQAAMDILRCNFPAVFVPQNWSDDVAIPTGNSITFNAISNFLSLNLEQAKALLSDEQSKDDLAKDFPQINDGPYKVFADEEDLIRLIGLMTDSFGMYDTLSDLRESDWADFTTKCFSIQMQAKHAQTEALSTEQKKAPKSSDEWIERFQPIANPKSEEYSGTFFETFGDDLKKVDELNRTEPGKVWTLIEGDDGRQYISSGFHKVNRIGYFLCEKPYTGASCEFLDDGVDEDEEEVPSYLKGTVFTTKDGRRHLTESARCVASDDLVFSDRFDSISGASKHLFLVEICDVESGSDPEEGAWEEAVYVELTDAQAKDFVQNPLYRCDFSNSPLEPLMNLRVSAEVCPDTDEFDFVEYNAIDDILKLSWAQFEKLVSDGPETDVIGEDQLPFAFKGKRTVRYDHLMLADLVNAFNGKEAFVGSDPEPRLRSVTKDMFQKFVSNGSRVRACHQMMADYNERVALSESPRIGEKN